MFAGLVYAMSYYPKFSAAELFLLSADCRKSIALALPNLGKFMALRRFQILKTFWRHTEDQRAHVPTREVFYRVQPLVTAFNFQRRTMLKAGPKCVVDESMFEWRGKDATHGIDGCPHVTKIPRKPKAVGMEVKNMADCDSGIMMAMEIVCHKDEIHGIVNTAVERRFYCG